MTHQRISQERSSSCRCSTTSHGDQKTTRWNASQMHDSFLFFCKKIWSRTVVISRSWFRESVAFYQWRSRTRWMGKNVRDDDVDIGRKRTPSFPTHESIVQRSAQKQRRWKIVDTLLCRPGHDYNCFSHNYFCQSAQSLRSSRRNVWRIWNLSMKERGHPLWEGSRVPHSYQAWSRQTCLWIMMIMLTKIFYCKGKENELKSYHNKTDWASFVWMQDSWMLLKIGQYFMTKYTAEFSQFTDAVTCREHICQMWTPKLDP